ncbi:RNA-binding protein 1-like [Oryza brachyantha]|uniref:RRM domain-containing protein n=1 Tax=Oryza brachyantha TaxID=4533 RepID=J3L4F5_ORYBR|nr:RNA-binding protein 1-like [Oryza brachyantha]
METAVKEQKGAAGREVIARTKLASHGKLFVGGVPLGTSESELRAHFSRFGKVAFVGTPKDKQTGASRGFAFVQFVSPDDAAAALAAGHQRHVLHGTTMDVKIAEPKSWDGVPPLLSCNKKKIFIGGLAPFVGEQQLTEYFSAFGEVSRAIVVTEIFTNMPRGFGFIEFALESSAARALRRERHRLCGQWVEVRLAMPKHLLAAGAPDQQDAAGSSRLSVLAPPFYPARSAAGFSSSSAAAAANYSTKNAPVIEPVTYVVGDSSNPNIGYEIPGVLMSPDVAEAVAMANYLRGGSWAPPLVAAYYGGGNVKLF